MRSSGKHETPARRLLSVLLCFAMLFGSSLPMAGSIQTVYAATVIGKINDKEYSDYSSMKKDLESMAGQTVTIEMLCDWDRAAAETAGMFAERLVIPSGSHVTLNMNGHMFNRDMTRTNSWEKDGELIDVESGAIFTVNGGSAESVHDAYVYSSIDKDGKAGTLIQVNGGLLTGGASSDGGGCFHVKKGATVTLNDVTIAGCRAQQKDNKRGDGGGMYLEGDNITVNLNNSTITGCYAYNDGGGIYTNESKKVTISLTNSHIDGNYANSDGGGISPDHEDATISGDGKSTISYNVCGEKGGGIKPQAKNVRIQNLIMVGNKADEGGAIYCDTAKVTLFGLVIESNYASTRAGGVHVRYDVNTILDCTIQNNNSRTGGGVYVAGDVDNDFNIQGITIIRNNGRAPVLEDGTWQIPSYDCEDLYFSDKNAKDNRVSFDLKKGSEVWITFRDSEEDELITLTPEKEKNDDCTKYLFSNQEGWYFAYNSEDGKIVRLRGYKADPTPATLVQALDANDASNNAGDGALKAGKVGTVGPGGTEGDEFDKIRGFCFLEFVDTISPFYYSDGLFYGDPNDYNEHLATVTWELAYAAGYLTESQPADASGNIYYNKHAGVRQMMADIGCPDQNIYINDFMVKKPGTDSIGVAIACKELARADGTKTGDILIPIAVRGNNYELEWASNLTLGTSVDMMSRGKEAMGFADAADHVFSEVRYYLKKYDLMDAYREGKVKFWVTGYSRAGATANLTSKRLVDMIAKDESKSQVFSYTCEAPQGGTNEAEVPGNDYSCIHNMLNKTDVVPYVAPSEMGFKRYGVDHYIPGYYYDGKRTVKKNTARITRSGMYGVESRTAYVDNEYLRIKSPGYVHGRRDAMLGQLAAIDPEIVYDDYFHPMVLDFVHYTFPFDVETLKIYETGDYVNDIEDFVPDFIRFLQEGKEPDMADHWSQAVNNRDVYAYLGRDPNYPTGPLQQALKDLMVAYYSSTQGDMDSLINRASNIQDEISYFSLNRLELNAADLYFNLVGEWHELNETEKNMYIFMFKNLLAGQEDNLINQALASDAFDTIFETAMHLVDGDYNYKPKNNEIYKWATGSNKEMMYLPTFMTFSNFIISCHLPQINIAWARSYDSWFDDELTYYKQVAPDTVSAPTAYVETETPEGKVYLTEDNTLYGDRKIVLENEDVVGEAVYYDLTDLDENTLLASNQIYRGGVDLAAPDDGAKSYEITTYDILYGVRSASNTYRFTLYPDKHNVTTVYRVKDDREVVINEVYRENDSVTVIGNAPDEKIFTSWKVSVLNKEGEYLEDVTEDLLAGDADKMMVSFTMPETGGKYPEEYRLRFDAQYRDKIGRILITAPSFEAGDEELANLPFTVRFMDSDGELLKDKEGNDLAAVLTGTWTYSYEKDGRIITVPTIGPVYNMTEYTAEITIYPDPLRQILFAQSVTGELDSEGNTAAYIQETSAWRNIADGSVTYRITFDPTGSEGDDSQETEESFEIRAFDLNLNDYDPDVQPVEYHTMSDTDIVLTAPDVPGERFVMWDFRDTGITLTDTQGLVDDNSMTSKKIAVRVPGNLPEGALIHAQYVPVVNKIDVNLYDGNGELFAPACGEGGPDRVTMTVTIANAYDIHPDNLAVEWSPELPESGIFAGRTVYTAGVKIVPDSEGKVKVKSAGADDGAYREIAMQFYLSDTVEAVFNGDSNNVAYEAENLTVRKVFPETQCIAVSFVDPDDITGLRHGTSREEILAMLPATVKLLVDDGLEGYYIDVPVNWDPGTLVPDKDVRTLEELVWSVTGPLDIPDDLIVNEPFTAEMTITAIPADHARPPMATLLSGTYLYSQLTSLVPFEEDGTTYYTLDGSDPNTGSAVYQGEEIVISRDSEYVQDELDRHDNPTGRKCIYVKAYTTVPGKFDSSIAVYKYVFDNAVPVPQGAYLEYTKEPQIGVHADYLYTLEAASKGVSIDELGNAVATEPGTYRVRAKLNYPDCKWIIDDEGGLTEKDRIVEFTIGEKPLYTLTFDLDGGILEGKTGTYTVEYPEDTEIVMPKPAKKGYTFDHWEGSSYKAGDKYVVTEDHTFLAIWKEEPAGETPEPTKPGTTVSPTKAAVTQKPVSGKATPTAVTRRTQMTAAAARAKTTAENNKAGTTPSTKAAGSRTGDNTNALFYIGLFALSAFIVVGLIGYRKKKNS